MRCVSWHGFNKLGGQNKGMSLARETELQREYEGKVVELFAVALCNPKDEDRLFRLKAECMQLEQKVQAMREVRKLTEECRKANGEMN